MYIWWCRQGYTWDDVKCWIKCLTLQAVTIIHKNRRLLRHANLLGRIAAHAAILHIFQISVWWIPPSADDNTVALSKPAYVYTAVCTSYGKQTRCLLKRGGSSVNTTMLYLHKKLISFPDTRVQSPSECCSLLNRVLFTYALVFICHARAYRFANCQD